jgi:hypothetical protein
MQKDDVFIGVSTRFGHHHAHHQENSTKPSTPMVLQTRGEEVVRCALVGNGFESPAILTGGFRVFIQYLQATA